MILASVSKLETKHGPKYGIKTPYNQRFVEMAKSVPGMAWDSSKRLWIGYADSVSVLLRQLEEKGFARISGTRPPPCVSLSVVGNALPDTLRTYQKIGVSFLNNVAPEGCLLADSMGLGKTRSALVAASHFPMPAVIVSPASVKRSWLKEAQFLGFDPFILDGTKPPSSGWITQSDGIVIVNYDIVHAWLPYLKGATTVVFDECHYLTNAKSRRSVACKELAKSAKNRVALSGTPMTSVVKELWNVVDTISPGRFGSWFMPFGMRYCNGHQLKLVDKEDQPILDANGDQKIVWNFDGKSHEEELQERMKHFMLRRTKQDVALELPPKTRQMIEIEAPNADLEEWTPSNISKSKAQRALHHAATSKLPHVIELVVDRHRDGGKIVVWTHTKEVARLVRKALAKKGVEAWLATGDETANKREENAARALGENGVLVATFDACGTGINWMVGFDCSVVAELHFVPAIMLQAEDRHHRPGQLNNVTIYYLIAIGTVDEFIREMLTIKVQTFETIIGSEGSNFVDGLRGMSEEESLEELRKLIGAMRD